MRKLNIVVGIGTYGDIAPLLYISKKLLSINQDVYFLANDYFESKVISRRVKFISIGSTSDFLSAHRVKYLSHNKKSFSNSAYIKKSFIKLSEYILKEYQNRNKNINVIVLSSNISTIKLCKKYKINTIIIYLYPSSINKVKPIAYKDLSATGRFVLKAYLLYRKVFNAKQNQYYKNMQRLALFPKWFMLGQNVSNDIHFSTFPFDTQETAKDIELEEYIAKQDKVILFTCGSGVFNQEFYFQQSLEITEFLDISAVFVSPDIENIRKFKSEFVYITKYIDFSYIFSKVDLVVHHGGIGTLAECLRSKVPQVIRPLDYDQPDNGWRVMKLGVGGLIYPKSYAQIEKSATFLNNIMTSQKIRSKIEEIYSRIEKPYTADNITNLFKL